MEARKMVITEHVEREKKRIPPKIKPPTPRTERAAGGKEKRVPVRCTRNGLAPTLELLDPNDNDPDAGYSKGSAGGTVEITGAQTCGLRHYRRGGGGLSRPVVTRFEIQPAPGVKVSRISNLARTWPARSRLSVSG